METTQKVELKQILGSFNYKITIPRDVEQKIRFACNKSWQTEWSGVLLYTYEGTFENDDLNIICKDIFLMDIGSAAYTEFDESPEVVVYMAQHPELLGCQLGLIHSHNNMATFLSGTDTATLKEEGEDRNNFVSLIVNNQGSYTAAITRKNTSTKTIKDCYSYEFFSEGKHEDCKEYTEESTVIEWFYLKINKEDDADSLKEFSDRFKEIEESKKASKVAKKNDPFAYNSFRKETYTPNTTTNIYSRNIATGPHGINLPPVKGRTLFDDYEKEKELNTPISKEEIKEEAIPYGMVRIDKKILKKSIAQLLTCALMINEDKFNLDDWVTNKMVKCYDRIFDNMKDFKYWSDAYVDYIIYQTEDTTLYDLGYDEIDAQAILAYDLMEELEGLPENPYLKVYIDCLNNYIV